MPTHQSHVPRQTLDQRYPVQQSSRPHRAPVPPRAARKKVTRFPESTPMTPSNPTHIPAGQLHATSPPEPAEQYHQKQSPRPRELIVPQYGNLYNWNNEGDCGSALSYRAKCQLEIVMPGCAESWHPAHNLGAPPTSDSLYGQGDIGVLRRQTGTARNRYAPHSGSISRNRDSCVKNMGIQRNRGLERTRGRIPFERQVVDLPYVTPRSGTNRPHDRFHRTERKSDKTPRRISWSNPETGPWDPRGRNTSF